MNLETWLEESRIANCARAVLILAGALAPDTRSRQMKSVRAMDCERWLEAERAVGVRPETPPTPALRRRKSELAERPCSEMEGQQWIGALSRSISLDEALRTEGVLSGEFSLAQLPVALIDACDHISIRHEEYGATRVERYCRRFAIVRRREDRWAVQPVDGQETLGDLIRHCDELGVSRISQATCASVATSRSGDSWQASWAGSGFGGSRGAACAMRRLRAARSGSVPRHPDMRIRCRLAAETAGNTLQALRTQPVTNG